MAGIQKKSGHAVTSVLPPHSDGVQVAPANIQFPRQPQNIAGMATAKKKFPPAS